MLAPPPHPDEARRLAALRSLDPLDTLPEERFDHVTRLAPRVLDVSYALTTLIDEDRPWLTSREDRHDLPDEMRRDVASRAGAVSSPHFFGPDGVKAVNDALVYEATRSRRA